MSRVPRVWVLAVLAVTAASFAVGCVQSLSRPWDGAPGTIGVDGAADKGPVAADKGAATAGDSRENTDAALGEPDADAESTAEPTLSCSTPRLAGKAYPGRLREPALRSDLLELCATTFKGQQKIVYCASRPDVDTEFGGWSQAGDLELEVGDPTFFTLSEQEMVAFSRGPTPRSIVVCPVGGGCSDVTFVDDKGNSIDGDKDGVSVVVLTDGPLMALNIGTTASPNAVYLARPEAADPASDDLTRWVAVPAEGAGSTKQQGDDPALGPDGTMLLVEGPGEGEDTGDIWVAYRTEPEGAFGTLKRLAAPANSSALDAGPDIKRRSDGQYDLVFVSDRGPEQVERIYHSVCTVAR